jgi:hypothetical protein
MNLLVLVYFHGKFDSKHDFSLASMGSWIVTGELLGGRVILRIQRMLSVNKVAAERIRDKGDSQRDWDEVHGVDRVVGRGKSEWSRVRRAHGGFAHHIEIKLFFCVRMAHPTWRTDTPFRVMFFPERIFLHIFSYELLVHSLNYF